MKASTELRLSSRSFTLWGKELPRYHSMLFAVDSYGGGVAFALEGERFRVNLSRRTSRSPQQAGEGSRNAREPMARLGAQRSQKERRTDAGRLCGPRG